MNPFFANKESLNLSDYLILTYWFESAIDPEEAAAHLCQEQSTAQWQRVGVNEDFRPKHGAKVINLEILEESDQSVYAAPFVEGKHFYQCEVKIVHPHINFGPKLPNLLTVVAGEGAFYSPGINFIKLMDIDFPENYLDLFEGPQFGVEGMRDLLGIQNRPFFFGVVKPNVGLPPKDFAKLAYESWLGGLDAPKDDEMLADATYSSLQERTKILGELREKAQSQTGEKKMFVANITDEVDKLKELHDCVVGNGVNAIMLNSWAMGLTACRYVRQFSRVPILGHFDFIAPFSRMPHFGMSVTLSIKLQRLAGIDVILFPGFGDRMKTCTTEVLANVKACLKPMGKIKPALPVPGGSDTPENLPKVFEALKTTDFGVVPGRAVFSHPEGPRAGAQAFRHSWANINTFEEN